jgi:ribonuclease-3
VAQRIRLEDALLLGAGEAQRGGAQRPAALAAALEAIIGAIYLSHGYEEAERFVLTHLAQEIAAPRASIGKGIKTALQEWTQAKNGSLPRYDIIATSGPEHERVYECAVRIDGNEIARGRGPSRRAAEAAAAEAAIDLLGVTMEIVR